MSGPKGRGVGCLYEENSQLKTARWERFVSGAWRSNEKKMRGSSDMNRTRRRLACDWSKQRAQLSARSELTTFCSAFAHGSMQLRGAALPRFRGLRYNQRLCNEPPRGEAARFAPPTLPQGGKGA